MNVIFSWSYSISSFTVNWDVQSLIESGDDSVFPHKFSLDSIPTEMKKNVGG